MSDSGPVRVVLDTSVLVAAARSRTGASFALISSIPAVEFQPCLSVGLYAEWQEVLTRPENLQPGQTPDNAGLLALPGQPVPFAGDLLPVAAVPVSYVLES